MRSSVASVAVAAALALVPATARAQQPPPDTVAQVLRQHVKSGVSTAQYEAARKKLGDGPTGAQLRKAALDKAGRTLGAGCSR